MKPIAALFIAITLSGCALSPQTAAQLSPDQIEQLARDKNASLFCAVINSPFGRGIVLSINADKMAVYGDLTVNEKCEVGLAVKGR